MRIVLWGKAQRGAAVLRAMHAAGRTPVMVVLQPGRDADECRTLAAHLKIPLFEPADPNCLTTAQRLRDENADVFVLAGYGQILKPLLIDLPRFGCVNLHAGELPRYRGSSPLNWALCNGEPTVTLSCIRADSGIDTGSVLADCTLAVGPNTTIAELHARANVLFAELTLRVLDRLEAGNAQPRPQTGEARYFPLRFPQDGLILWDQLTAQQIHNHIRALSPPYRCAFTYYAGRRVRLVKSELCQTDYRGVPGRIYRQTPTGLLVCAADRCLWLREAYFDDGSSLLPAVRRYQELATVRAAALRLLATPAGASPGEDV